MKGYFSQLARHTGLHFTSAARSTIPGSPIANSDSKPPVFGEQNASPAAPLHVEEVTLVSPTPTASTLSTSTEPIGRSVPENAQTDQTSETTPSVQPSQTAQDTQAESVRSFPEAFAVHESSQADDTGQGSSDTRDTRSLSQVKGKDAPRGATEHQSPFPERNTEQDQVSTTAVAHDLQAERAIVSTTQPQPHEPTTNLPSQTANDLDPRDPVQREVLVRQYLREVRAWVAAPPTPIPDVPEKELTQATQLTSKWQPENSAVEREPLQPATQATQLDVHETSLSIGSISVVIEDPKPAVTTIAPTPSAPKSQPPTTQPEPISLSRYYLQRW